MNEFERLIKQRLDEEWARAIDAHSCPRCKILLLQDRYGEWCPICGYKPEAP